MTDLSIGSSKARESWGTCLQKLQDERNLVDPDANRVKNEEEFRDRFLALDPDLHDRGDPRLSFAHFARYHDDIHTFARTLDDALGLNNTAPSIKETFWTIALAVVEVAFAYDQEFDLFKDIYKDLNRDLPQFADTDLQQFPKILAVQQCLQHIFEAYHTCYIELIKAVKVDAQYDPDLDLVRKQIEEASTIYRKQELDWKAQCDLAQRDAERVNITDTRFEYLKALGEGSYGKVDVVRESTTGSVYARKSIPLNAGGQEPKTIEQRVRNEADIMTKLRHNHIANVCMLFKEAKWNIIMLPVADMDLRTFLEEKCISQNFPVDALRKMDPWFGCLISALTYAHDESVKHEDIKPKNILIKGNKIYLTDFGTAKDFSEMEASTVSDYLEQGTPIYWAPEPRAWGRAADVFALGCVFSEMLTVRQGKELTDFRKFRFNNNAQGFGYAYRTSLPKVRRWLKDELGISSKDPTAQTILEQTLNMLIESSGDRLEARRIKRNMRVDEQLFCVSCA